MGYIGPVLAAHHGAEGEQEEGEGEDAASEMTTVRKKEMRVSKVVITSWR